MRVTNVIIYNEWIADLYDFCHT